MSDIIAESIAASRKEIAIKLPLRNYNLIMDECRFQNFESQEEMDDYLAEKLYASCFILIE